MEVLRSVGGRAGGLRGGRALRSGVVVTEVALSFILLIGAGLMLRSVRGAGARRSWLRSEPRPDVRAAVAGARRPGSARRSSSRCATRLRAIPGVQRRHRGDAAAARRSADQRPLGHRGRRDRSQQVPAGELPRRPARILRDDAHAAASPAGCSPTPTTTSISRPTCRGRSSSTTRSRRCAFRGEPAVGKRLFLRITTPEPEWYDVIGVVAHQRHSSLAVPGPEAIFIPTVTSVTAFAGAMGGADHRRSESDRHRPSAPRWPQIDPRAPLAEVQPMHGVRRQGDGAGPLHDAR